MNTYEYQRLRGLKRKIHLIELRGGSCEECGYNKNIAAFDFHHKDPTQKKFKLDIRILANNSMEKILVEFNKCVVLCANCHREEHSPDLTISNVKILTEQIDTDVYGVREVKKPNCLDCGCEINYGSIRCTSCRGKNDRRVNRPNLDVLLKEIEEHSQEWCANKYGVSRSSIRRWIK